MGHGGPRAISGASSDGLRWVDHWSSGRSELQNTISAEASGPRGPARSGASMGWRRVGVGRLVIS